MRKNADRFNGVSEKELYEKSLPDVIDFNLDIVFVNINPGLYSVYKQHHYSGPGNHFWRCVHESGLTNRVLKSWDDFKLLDYKIGLMNMMEKPTTKTCQDMTPEEIAEAQQNLIRKVRLYKPKIVAFNGKSIYEIYTGQSVDKEFNFGKQATKFDSNKTDIFTFVLPSSSARCSQLPKVIDKVPFYLALKKLRDHLNGFIQYLSDDDIMFPDFKVALDSRNSLSNENQQNESDVDDDLGDLEDKNTDFIQDDNETDTTGKNVHRIKFVRLNNLPYSQIPAYILEDLKKQRVQRKGVTITTTRDFFNMKKSLKKSVNHNSSLNIATGSCSDLDTQSTATSDSDYGTATSSTLDSNEPFNSSKISSIIFNVYSNNSPKYPITPKHLASEHLAHNQTVKQILNKNTSQTKVADPQSKKINVILSNNSPIQIKPASQSKPNQHPAPIYIIQTQQSPAQQQINQSSHIVLKPIADSQANFTIIPSHNQVDFELIKNDHYQSDEFYTFSDNQPNHNTFYLLSDEYFHNLKNDLNRSVKLFYDHDDADDHETENGYPSKRLFSSVYDASSYVLSTNKKYCAVDISKL